MHIDKPNKFRDALLARKLTIGAWMQIGHPAIAEIFAKAGFDWVCVDLEHGAIDIETTANIFRAIDAFDCVPVARLPLNDPIWIHRVLDAGARGLIIPMVNTGDEARKAVECAKHPPLGKRGFGFCRASTHDFDFKEYVKYSNSHIAVIAQIEHKTAIHNIEDILSVNGIDGVFIGPYDLSGSMGIVGQLNHEKMTEALNTYLEACDKYRKPAGTHVVYPTQAAIEKAKIEGYTTLALGLDTTMLGDTARTAKSVLSYGKP